MLGVQLLHRCQLFAREYELDGPRAPLQGGASRCSSVRVTTSQSHFIAGRNRVGSKASRFCNHGSSHPNTEVLNLAAPPDQPTSLNGYVQPPSGQLFVLHSQMCTGMVVKYPCRARHGRPHAEQGSQWCWGKTGGRPAGGRTMMRVASTGLLPASAVDSRA